MLRLYKKCCFLGFILIFTQSQPALSSETLRFVASDWCPYLCLQNNKVKERPGLLWEILEKSFQLQGQESVVTELPLTRGIKEVHRGTFHGILGVYYQDDSEYIFHEIPVAYASPCFFSNNTEWTYQGLPSLDNQILGVVARYHYEKELNHYISQFRDDRQRIVRAFGFHPLNQLLKMLRSNRIQLLFEDLYVTRSQMIRQEISGIHVRHCLEPAALYVGFSAQHQNSQQLASLLDLGLKQLHESGEVERIIRSYLEPMEESL